MYPKRPIFSRMRSCLAVSLLFLLATMGAGLVRSAPPAQAPQTAAAVQQESIALQITSIADSAAGTQTSSFQSQLKAVQQQYGVTRDSEAPSDMAPLPEPDKVAEPALPANASIAVPGTAEPDPASADLAFYSVPWPRPADFVMPNIQVGTD